MKLAPVSTARGPQDGTSFTSRSLGRGQGETDVGGVLLVVEVLRWPLPGQRGMLRGAP